MSTWFTEEETIRVVGRLTRTRLTALMAADLVRPAQSPAGPRFTRMDIARLELICDLRDEFGMQDEALEMVLSLVDQLHGVRAELRVLADAVALEPEEVRARIAAAVRRAG